MTTTAEGIRQEIDRTRENLSYDVDALAYKASPSRIMEERKQRITGALRHMRETVMGTAEEAGDRISDMAHSVGDTAAEAPAQVRRQTQGNPLAAGLIAFGVGWLASSVIPASDSERRAVDRAKEAVGEHGDQAKEQLTRAAQQVTGNLRAPVREAVDKVKQTATEATDTVRDDAVAGAQAVGDHARQAARRMS